MVVTWKKAENLYFDSDASIVRRVGRESISNPIVALVEIIKNSYDADATKVRIIIEDIKHGEGIIRIVDDGSGMTSEELSKKWMVLSTDDKERNPLTAKRKRIKIGEKGIGRMGMEGVSKKLEIISKPLTSNKMFRIEIDWDKYSPGTLLNKIPNTLSEAPKKRNEQGFEVVLSDLIETWDEEKIRTLREQVSLITPLGIDLSFSVEIVCKDYPSYEGIVESDFLKKYLFHFKATLDGKGTAVYFMKQRKGKSYKLPEKGLRFSCGPLYLEFYFFYREAQKYPEEDIDITNIKKILDSYGGIKLYRDDFLVRLQGEDWLGLNQMRVQDPSMIPGTDQVFGFVKITKSKNPLIKDTTNREGLIENDAYKDMIAFFKRAIDNFKLFRKQIEYYEGTRKKKPIQEQIRKGVTGKKGRKKPKKEIPPAKEEAFIDFSKLYPDIFYKKLENEINQCYISKLPNATLVLCRKMIENLMYNVLYFKFPKRADLRFNIKKGWPHNFSLLLDNLESKKNEFKGEEKVFLSKAISRIKPFVKHANSKAHNIMEYLDDVSELDKLKIPEMIQVLLNLIRHINTVGKK
jgi:hypothetical protein